MRRLLLIGLLLFIAGGLSAAEPPGKRFAGEKAGQVWDGNDLGMKFCWCPPGKFMMGSPKGEPNRLVNEAQVEVTLSRGFWLGKFETTQGEWEKVMGTTLGQQRDKANPKFDLYGEGVNFPMYYVTYDEALAFCAKLTEQERRAGRLPADWDMTLPTEAQWEYACRAGTTTATTFGDKLSRTFPPYGSCWMKSFPATNLFTTSRWNTPSRLSVERPCCSTLGHSLQIPNTLS